VPTIILRIRFEPEGHIGHGKVELLERIAASGSIAAAARQMTMSYKRAWDLIEEMNRIFGRPMLETQKGGPGGGGARLTGTGAAVVARYRAIEQAAALAAAPHIAALEEEIDVKGRGGPGA
jgi:molybdate transport system regulatory protein